MNSWEKGCMTRLIFALIFLLWIKRVLHTTGHQTSSVLGKSMDNFVLFLWLSSNSKIRHVYENFIPLDTTVSAWTRSKDMNFQSPLKHSWPQKKDPRMPSLVILYLWVGGRLSDLRIAQLIARRAFQLRWGVAIGARRTLAKNGRRHYVSVTKRHDADSVNVGERRSTYNSVLKILQRDSDHMTYLVQTAQCADRSKRVTVIEW